MRYLRFIAPLLVLAAMLFVSGDSAAAPGDDVADRVFGQTDFTTDTCNTGGLGASSLCRPLDVARDSAGNVYVADAGNNRVLVYNSPLTDTVADLVFGQGGSFTSDTCNLGGVSASSLCLTVTGGGGTLLSGAGLAVDGSGNVYVADTFNHRTLVYLTPLTTDTVADVVFGQGGDFTTQSAGCADSAAATAASLCSPNGLAVDGSGNLYVVDSDNNRVLVYSSPLTTDTVADYVFGQGGSFTAGACDTGSASVLCLAVGTTAGGGVNTEPRHVGLALDGSGNLYLADIGNNRVLVYNDPLNTDVVADYVFGQADFSLADCNTGGRVPGPPTASTMCGPSDVGFRGGDLFVVDSANSRLLIYDQALTTDAVADMVFGQGGSFTSNACNLGGISASSLCVPTGLTFDGAGNPYAADWWNSRSLAYLCPTYAPPWAVPPGDHDCDGFPSSDEALIGTDPSDRCANTVTADDEADDKWPSDFDDNTVVNISDVFQVLPPYFGTSVPPTSARRDLAPDGVINISDVFKVLPPYFGVSCT